MQELPVERGDVRTFAHARIQRSRALLGAAVIASLLTLGSGAVGAGASTQLSATESAFCNTLLHFHAKAPSGTTYSSYQKWAKTYLPFWEKLASEAPSGSVKTVLNELVTIVKYEANAKNVQAIGVYMSTHQKQWLAGWKAFAKAAMSCATSMY